MSLLLGTVESTVKKAVAPSDLKKPERSEPDPRNPGKMDRPTPDSAFCQKCMYIYVQINP